MRIVSDSYSAVRARNKRAANKEGGRCINENKKRTHGPPTPGGVRCEACDATYRKSAHRKAPVPRSAPRPDAAAIARAARHWLRSDQSLTAVAEHFGVNRSAVWHAAQKEGMG
jgi:hypothetical protein